MIRKSGFLFIFLGVFSVLFFVLMDTLGIGNDRETLGAAQVLGIELGIILTAIGAGFFTFEIRNNKSLKEYFFTTVNKVLELPPVFWVVLTFLVLYLLFFVSPMFFSKIKIQYFSKYIPDAWTTRLGFDIETTVTHINDWLTKGVSPYADGSVPYTPLALAVFTPFLILGYPGYFKLLTIITVICYILTAFLIPLFVAQKKEYGILLLLGIMGLFSYGFQFEIERGQFNMLAFAACLFAIYLFHFQHKFRYFAYLLFSLAIQLKLYPAIFIFMFVRDWRDWKSIIRRFLGLGIFNFLLLFVMGYQLFLDFINQITTRQLNMQSSRYEDLSISGFVYSLSEGNSGWLSQYAHIIGTLILILFGIMILTIVLHLYRSRQSGLNPYLLMVCTIGALMIPPASFDYKLPVLVAPMIILLSSIPSTNNIYKKAATIVIVIVMSIAYWSTLYPYDVKSPLLFRNSPALLIIYFTTAILYFMFNGKFEKIIATSE
jgi:hypothetical protein